MSGKKIKKLKSDAQRIIDAAAPITTAYMVTVKELQAGKMTGGGVYAQEKSGVVGIDGQEVGGPVHLLGIFVPTTAVQNLGAAMLEATHEDGVDQPTPVFAPAPVQPVMITVEKGGLAKLGMPGDSEVN